MLSFLISEDAHDRCQRWPSGEVAAVTDDRRREARGWGYKRLLLGMFGFGDGKRRRRLPFRARSPAPVSVDDALQTIALYPVRVGRRLCIAYPTECISRPPVKT